MTTSYILYMVLVHFLVRKPSIGLSGQSMCQCLPVCLCLSVTTLVMALYGSTFKLRCKQIYYGTLLISNALIFIKLLCSEVMASFAYCDSLLEHFRMMS